jgi:hypothetical protein
MFRIPSLSMRKTKAVCCPIVILLSAAASLHASEALPPVDRFRVMIGPFWSDNDLKVRWDSTATAPGTYFSFQRDLGFDPNHDVLFWNVGGALGRQLQHKFEANGYGYRDNSSAVVQRDLVVQDDFYPVGASFNGNLDFDTTSMAYTWFFHRGDRRAMGVGIGALNYRIDIDLMASVSAGDTTIRLSNKYAVDEWAPMLRSEYARTLSSHWRWRAMASYVKTHGGAIEGDALDAFVELEYFPWRNAGLSFRYSYSEVDLELERSAFKGRIRLRERGLQVLASLRY